MSNHIIALYIIRLSSIFVHNPCKFAIYFLHNGHVLCPFLIHASMQLVWYKCLSSHNRGVTTSFLLKSAQQIAHCVCKLPNFVVLNLVLLNELKISGIGSGTCIKPPIKLLSKKLLPLASFLFKRCSTSWWIKKAVRGKKNESNMQ